MQKLLVAVIAATFALGGSLVHAADAPAAKPAAAPAKLEKPANVTAEAWAKMSDDEKKKAVAAASAAGGTKKEKKGGC
jgi:Ni/Co efflux regulator RcnB